MRENKNLIAQKLMETFMQFKRGHWKTNAAEGLKHSEMVVLFCIKHAGTPKSPGVKISEISRTLKVANPTVTQLISGLEAKGLVLRTMDPSDRRAVRVNLTNKGEDVVGKASDTFFESFNGLVDYLGEADSIKLAELLDKVFIYFDRKNKPET